MTPSFLFFKKIFKNMMRPFSNCLTSWIVRVSCFVLDIPTLKEDLSRICKVSRSIISFNLLRQS